MYVLHATHTKGMQDSGVEKYKPNIKITEMNIFHFLDHFYFQPVEKWFSVEGSMIRSMRTLSLTYDLCA